MNINIVKIIFHCIHYKLLDSEASRRIYDLCLEITYIIFNSFGLKAKEIFENIFQISTQYEQNYYVKSLYNEIDFLFSLNPGSDILTETDRRGILRILNYDISILKRYSNICVTTENLLKTIDKKDTFAVISYVKF